MPRYGVLATIYAPQLAFAGGPAFNIQSNFDTSNTTRSHNKTTTNTTTTNATFDLSINSNTGIVSGLQARNLETRLNDKLVASGRTVTPGDLYAVTVRRGKYQDGVPYQAGQEIQPTGDGSVIHILEAFGVSAGGETINFKRVTDAELRKNFSAAAGKEGVGGEYITTDVRFDTIWKFKDYIRDIELQTGRKLTNEQINRLGDAIRSNNYVELSKAEKAYNRTTFDNKRIELIVQWQKMTGQKWPKYDECVFDKNGKIVRSPKNFYDAHEIIPNSYGGPLEWWNIHPAKWPNEHQGGIHRASGILDQILNK